MKASISVLAAVLALGASAAPNPQLGAAESNQAKLPWIEKGDSPDKCGEEVYTDQMCGTDVYCKAHDNTCSVYLEGDMCGTDYCKSTCNSDKAYLNRPKDYKSSELCFNAHEPRYAKLPWIGEEEATPFLCHLEGYSNERCGTDVYCRAHDTTFDITFEEMRPKDYENAQACFNAHEPRPAKLPWIEEGVENENNDCGARDYTDKMCGTDIYCKAHDFTSDMGLQYANKPWDYEDAQACFDAHEPRPAGSRPTWWY